MRTTLDLEIEKHPELARLDINGILFHADYRRLFEPGTGEIQVATEYDIHMYPELLEESELGRLAYLGTSEIYVLLGDAFKYGNQVDKDLGKAELYYKIASERGYTLGMEYIAALYLNDDHESSDTHKAFGLLSNAVELNGGECRSSFGNYALGNMYYLGFPEPQNIEKASEFFHSAMNRSEISDYGPGEDPYYWRALYRFATVKMELSHDASADYLEYLQELKDKAVMLYERGNSHVAIDKALVTYDTFLEC